MFCFYFISGSVLILSPIRPPILSLGKWGLYLSGLGECLVRLRAYSKNEPKVTFYLPGPIDATLL